MVTCSESTGTQILVDDGDHFLTTGINFPTWFLLIGCDLLWRQDCEQAGCVSEECDEMSCECHESFNEVLDGCRDLEVQN